MAIGDDVTCMAFPLTVITYTKIAEVFFALNEYIKKEEVETVVVGKPTTREGQSRAITEDTQVFVQKLKEEIAIPVAVFDERLTSKAADALIAERGAAGQDRDAIAAMVILQNYLDAVKTELQTPSFRL